MAGLVAYASSDDEEDNTSQHAPSAEQRIHQTDETKTPPTKEVTAKEGTTDNSKQEAPASAEPHKQETPHPQPPSVSKQEPVLDEQPTIGPSLPEAEEAPSSPYTSTRTMIHDLTLPSIPSLDIPPSPPGSPPRATTARFQQFLNLKRQETHFNSKLENSAALRNPALTDKLLSFVELTGAGQYETTLSLDLYDPSGFPEWSHREALRKARDEVVKEREDKAGSRSSVDFVSASKSPGVSTGTGSSREKKKSAWK